MKKSQLRKIVQEAIQEVLNEADLSPAEKTAKDAKMKAIDAEIKALQTKKGDLASGREQVAENELDEMANVAVRYELAPDAAAADFTGKKSRIIAAMQATEEPMSKPEVAAAMGYDKQNPINSDFMALVASGVIVPSGEQRAPRMTRPTPAATPTIAGDDEDIEGEEEEMAADEDGIINRDLSDEEVDAMFASAMRDEDEPEIEDIETVGTSVASMSDEDYEAFMQYSDLEQRLAKVKSDILKAKRSRGTAGDLSDRPSGEVERLRDLKTRLQGKMSDLLSSSAYLRKRKGGTADVEDIEGEEEQLDEWTINRMQFYAGIKK